MRKDAPPAGRSILFRGPAPEHTASRFTALIKLNWDSHTAIYWQGHYKSASEPSRYCSSAPLPVHGQNRELFKWLPGLRPVLHLDGSLSS